MKQTNKSPLLLLMVFTCIVFSQNQSQLGIDNNKMHSSLQVMSHLSASKNIDAEGSPYLNENFAPITVKGYENLVLSGRFNAFNGEMEVSENEQIMRLDNNASYEVTFSSLNIVYRTTNYITKKGEEKRGFLRILKKGENYIFYKKETIKFYDKIPTKSGYEPEKPAEFKREKDKFYLFLTENKIASYFPTKKNELLKVFPKHAKVLKTYIKKNKLSLKKEEDLVKLAEYISTLK